MGQVILFNVHIHHTLLRLVPVGGACSSSASAGLISCNFCFQLEMENDDSIDVFQQQTGGSFWVIKTVLVMCIGNCWQTIHNGPPDRQTDMHKTPALGTLCCHRAYPLHLPLPPSSSHILDHFNVYFVHCVDIEPQSTKFYVVCP